MVQVKEKSPYFNKARQIGNSAFKQFSICLKPLKMYFQKQLVIMSNWVLNNTNRLSKFLSIILFINNK